MNASATRTYQEYRPLPLPVGGGLMKQLEEKARRQAAKGKLNAHSRHAGPVPR